MEASLKQPAVKLEAGPNPSTEAMINIAEALAKAAEIVTEASTPRSFKSIARTVSSEQSTPRKPIIAPPKPTIPPPKPAILPPRPMLNSFVPSHEIEESLEQFYAWLKTPGSGKSTLSHKSQQKYYDNSRLMLNIMQITTLLQIFEKSEDDFLW